MNPWVLVGAYGLGCALAIVVGVALGDHLESKPPCLPGMTQVVLDGQTLCMTNEKLRSMESGWCGAHGTYAKAPGGAFRLDECVDR